ncbi:MAG TPA: hypothetical protein VFV97_15650 [Rhodanobacteraceae bacterium]|nr:hypothetical protein [Rhodanobacteraceae bacterium]
MSVAYLVAWLTPLTLGSGLFALLDGRPRTPADFMRVFGGGFVLGALATAFALAPLGRVDVDAIVPRVAIVLLPLAIGAWAWVLLRERESTAPTPPDARRMHPLIWCLLALLAIHAWLMADEILLRPMYPWDAWAAWLLKPKAWMLGGHLDAFVGFDEWLADASGTLRTAQSWNYPEALGRLALWFASAWGDWNAGVVGAIWFALWAALLAGVYGGLRALGLARDRAIVAIYALGSLPLINVHVALAGYADLWIAALIAFACLSWMRGLETGARGPFVLAALFALLLPAVKLEGAIWLVLLAGTMLYAWMPLHIRRVALVLAPVIGAGIVLAYLARLPLIAPALDRIGLSADTDVLLAHAPAVIGAAAEGLFAQYNWHLFWIAFALTLVVRFAKLKASPPLRFIGLFLLLGSAFLFALFVLTPAGKWAESYTAVNRLSLQIVPAMLVFAALLWREPAPNAARAAPARMAEAAPLAP